MTKNGNGASRTLNLLSALPTGGADEAIETLLRGQGLRVERIVSYGHASASGAWYHQAEDEWVLVLRGRARLAIDGEGQPRDLGPGDSLFLPAHCRHRVTWTAPGEPTVWLTIFSNAQLAVAPGA